MQPPSLKIGVPVYESVPAHSFGCFLSISEAGPWEVVRGTWIPKARNQIMENFTEDLLLMLDSDMVFEVQDVARLIQAIRAHPECGAISGDYVMRNGSGLPTYDWHHPEDPEGWLSDEDRDSLAKRHRRDGSLTYVDSFGAGFLIITQEAKQKVGSPWFLTGYDSKGNFQGEDTYFCGQLQKAGFKPAVHFGIPVGHCGLTVYQPSKGEE